MLADELRQIPLEALRFSADLQVDEQQGEAKPAPIRLLARSGRPIDHWFWGKVVHDLSGMQLSKPRVPIDYCHNDDEVIGFASKFDTASGDLVVSGALVPYGPDDRATEVLFKARQGVPYEASINFGGDGIVAEEIPAGAVTEVNGHRFEGPGTVIRQWPLRGVAVCPYGADQHTEAEFKQERRQIGVKFTQQESRSMSDLTNEPAAAEEPVEKTEPKKLDEEQPEEETPTEAEPAPAPAASEGEKFLQAFGDKGGVWFAQGKTFADAQTLFTSELRTENDALKKENKELRAKLATQRGEPKPVTFQAEATEEQAIAAQFSTKIGPNLGRFAAGLRIGPRK